jgi:thiol-disulfide isomerase/thioredoxin
MVTSNQGQRRRWSARATWIAIAASAAAFATAAILDARIGQDTGPLGTPPVEASFTYFDGTRGSLADFRGRPLVVNFWASWCPACVAEMPGLEKVHAQFGERVAFIGLNMQEVSAEAAQQLALSAGVKYALAGDPDGAIYRQFGGIAMPTTVLISTDGEVVRVISGPLFAEELASLIELELLTAEPSSG